MVDEIAATWAEYQITRCACSRNREWIQLISRTLKRLESEFEDERFKQLGTVD